GRRRWTAPILLLRFASDRRRCAKQSRDGWGGGQSATECEGSTRNLGRNDCTRKVRRFDRPGGNLFAARDLLQPAAIRQPYRLPERGNCQGTAARPLPLTQSRWVTR